jgi:hypothetical protein
VDEPIILKFPDRRTRSQVVMDDMTKNTEAVLRRFWKRLRKNLIAQTVPALEKDLGLHFQKFRLEMNERFGMVDEMIGLLKGLSKDLLAQMEALEAKCKKAGVS